LISITPLVPLGTLGDEDHHPIVALEELLRLGRKGLEGAEPVFGEPLGLVRSAVGARKLRVEFEIRADLGPQPVPVAPGQRLVCAPDDLDVLLRPRLPSISQDVSLPIQSDPNASRNLAASASGEASQ
jgi:hypothetical protein